MQFDLRDLATQISLGKVKDHYCINKFAASPALPSGTESIIWDGGTTAYQGFLLDEGNAETLEVVSTSANDDASGTYAQILQIYGCGENFELQSEIIAMDGLTPVTTTKTWLRVWRMQVLLVGSAGRVDIIGPNEGTITATTSTTGYTMAQINPQTGNTLMGVFTVPAGYNAIIPCFETSVGQGKDVQVISKSRLNGTGVNTGFNYNYSIYLYQNLRGLSQSCTYAPLPEKLDFCFVGRATSSGVPAACEFQIILFPKEFIGKYGYNLSLITQ